MNWNFGASTTDRVFRVIHHEVSTLSTFSIKFILHVQMCPKEYTDYDRVIPLGLGKRWEIFSFLQLFQGSTLRHVRPTQTSMPGSYDTVVLKDFDSLKISRPDFNQSLMSNKYLFYCCFHSWKYYLYKRSTVIWHYRVREYEVPMVPRYSQNFSMGQSNVAKIVKKKCCYIVKCNISYKLTENKQKATNLILRNSRSTNKTKIKKRNAKMQNFQLM
jgi:hypothetical protein